MSIVVGLLAQQELVKFQVVIKPLLVQPPRGDRATCRPDHGLQTSGKPWRLHYQPIDHGRKFRRILVGLASD